MAGEFEAEEIGGVGSGRRQVWRVSSPPDGLGALFYGVDRNWRARASGVRFSQRMIPSVQRTSA